jgi:hypothetical protein
MSTFNATDGSNKFLDSIDLDGKTMTTEDLAKQEALEDAIATEQLKQAMAESTGFMTILDLLAMRSIDN